MRVPRNFLGENFYEADGATQGVFLVFSFPLFEPISKMEPNQIVVTANIAVASKNLFCVSDHCFSYLEMTFFEYIAGLSFYTHPNETVRKAQEIIKVNAVEKKTRGYFRLSGEGYEAAFHRQDDGDIAEWFFLWKNRELLSVRIYFSRQDAGSPDFIARKPETDGSIQEPVSIQIYVQNRCRGK